MRTYTVTGGGELKLHVQETGNPDGKSILFIHGFSQCRLALEDFYFFLGYNVIVPPYVRLGLLSRHLNNDPVIERMHKPMLLSHGEQDAIVLLSMGQHVAGLAKHAQLSVYPHVGHAPFWEASERFNHELREFRDAV